MNEKLCGVAEIRRVSDSHCHCAGFWRGGADLWACLKSAIILLEKQTFYEKLKNDFSGHVGKYYHRFDSVHGEYCESQTNMEGTVTRVWLVSVSNTWFTRKDKRMVVFKQGENKTENEFIMVTK